MYRGLKILHMSKDRAVQYPYNLFKAGERGNCKVFEITLYEGFFFYIESTILKLPFISGLSQLECCLLAYFFFTILPPSFLNFLPPGEVTFEGKG